jgi:DNA-binding NtrC family response regulator
LYAEGSDIVRQIGSSVKQSPTISVVDDRPPVLESVKAILKLHDYPVECYSSSSEFIAYQSLNDAGCVLVDPLRNSDGHAVLKWLYKFDNLLSIVLISGLIDCGEDVGKTTVPRISELPYLVSALFTMMADRLAGSISRKVIRNRGRLMG